MLKSCLSINAGGPKVKQYGLTCIELGLIYVEEPLVLLTTSSKYTSKYFTLYHFYSLFPLICNIKDILPLAIFVLCICDNCIRPVFKDCHCHQRT